MSNMTIRLDLIVGYGIRLGRRPHYLYLRFAVAPRRGVTVLLIYQYLINSIISIVESESAYLCGVIVNSV